ncbi:MAG: hypothetical protein ACR2LT_01215 [Pyrinomonadaceae bacterium]
MKTIVLIILIASLSIIVLAQTGASNTPPKVFEYKYENRPSEEKANELGTVGWELVAIQGATDHNFNATYVFKQEKK